MSLGREYVAPERVPVHEDSTSPGGTASSWRAVSAGALLVVGAFAVVLAGVESVVFDLERYLVPKAFVLHGTALGLLALGFPALRSPRWGAAEWLLVAFVVQGAVSAGAATNRWLALSAWGIGASSVVILLACRELAHRVRRPVLAGLVSAAVLGGVLGVAQAYGAGWEWLADTRPPGGTFGNRNFLAHVSVLAVPPLVVTAVRTRRAFWLVPALVGLAALAGAVVLTRSRAAWLGGIGGVVTAAVVLLAARRAAGLPKGRAVAIGGVLAAAIAAAVFLPNQLRWSTESPYVETLARLTEYAEGSGRGRLIQYRNSLDLVPERPVLGIGPGNWFVHYPRVTRGQDPSFAAHLTIPTNPWPSSDWVAFLTERGALGALLLLLAGGAAAGRALARARRGTREEAYSAAALVGLLVTALVVGSFDAVLLLAAPSFLVFAATGLLLPEPRRVPVWAPGGRARAAVRGTTALLLLVLLGDAASRTAAIAAAGDGRDRPTLARAARVSPGEHRLHLLLAERGDCDAARRAAALMPHHPVPDRLVRRCSE